MAEGEAGSGNERDFTVFPDVDLTRVYDQNNDSKVSKMENWVNDGALSGTRGAPPHESFKRECFIFVSS